MRRYIYWRKEAQALRIITEAVQQCMHPLHQWSVDIVKGNRSGRAMVDTPLAVETHGRQPVACIWSVKKMGAGLFVGDEEMNNG